VFVRHLPHELTQKELYELFSQFGPIESCKLKRKEEKSLGYAYIQFKVEEDASKAIEAMNNKEINGSKIEVSHFEKKSQRPIASVYVQILGKEVPQESIKAALE